MVDRFRVLALAGGVGGAKLAYGLARSLGDRLTVLVNTGDDFEHLGLHISPDLDTVMYTLGGIANPETGWGVAGDNWNCLDQIGKLGGPSWFRLGDKDLATHVLRTNRLRRGESLTAITNDLCRALNITSTILPMTDDTVRTIVHSYTRTLPFQDYFVRLRCDLPVTRLSFDGAETAKFNEGLSKLAKGQEPICVIICPSNPYLSIDPIFSLPGLKDWIHDVASAVIAVSPIVGGAAIKGPAAKIMGELGVVPSALSVARHYRDVAGGFVMDRADAADADEVRSLGMEVVTTQTVMRDLDGRVTLAHDCLDFAKRLMKERS
ncbi:2-phospho-L-lactate transferase [Bradyrhizobium sp. AUGA SZCCT0182]|uniref:2-phospho-L-lactate transferase n=1 Tax=Bradyrhizobium sp. AUGA SZCCT0182 TaxID=2807667 RepID=UPI001BA9CDF1|nr:2-phospho-L-lactate transferase [Bradyrhizobium sp. AUGA SZCCT0182]MBR1231724.1 2-phospho-L-lactate transferase [Bradyrhizobium sp. AUGA SZCCT0182]